jgi:hypothetical protein
MGQVGGGQLRQAVARSPCSACARVALTTALRYAAPDMAGSSATPAGAAAASCAIAPGTTAARTACAVREGVSGGRQRSKAMQHGRAYDGTEWVGNRRC